VEGRGRTPLLFRQIEPWTTVATYLRGSGIFNYRFTANLLLNRAVRD